MENTLENPIEITKTYKIVSFLYEINYVVLFRSAKITINLIEVLNMIKVGLTTEGDASMYIPRMEAEMPQEIVGELEAFTYGSGRICGSTTSVYGAGRKHRLLSPAMYNAHNVNDNFAYSLSKRNR